ncbi:xylose repressor protein [Ktedonobacter sp. SOSP1-85]|uniref:ROK family protein n=1 Tax=Ktedonobacter sp. SOSP1-85 TaxID=2778367 RepID=UPI001916900F|nr:ROK family protein [Ktedonobacter sp. SOSP1-85]GHO79795.1 xylose repressor protein [Ktedonobacter sp. SOSP1-85]
MQGKAVPADRKLIRAINQNNLLNLIRLNAPISRPQLAELSGLSLATVIGLTGDLIGRHFVVESGPAESTGGRKATLLDLHPEGGFALGLMVRGFECIGVVVNLRGDVIFSLHWDTVLRHQGAQALEHIVRMTNDLLAQSGVEKDLVIGLGCALSGYIDAQNGICIDSWNLDWHSIELAEPLSRRLGFPVVIDNDVSCITTYERLFGWGGSSENFFTVVLGRGVGLGLVLNGEVYHGSTGGAGEFGHMVAVPGGRRCECGKRGCLEEYISFRGIIANYLERNYSQTLPFNMPLDSSSDRAVRSEERVIHTLLELALNGDELAAQAFQHSGELMGIALANLVNVLNPESIVLTGEGVFVEPAMFQSMEAVLRQNLFSQLGKNLRLLVEPLVGYESWARGAAALVLHRFFVLPAHP